jgi:hypothetical protein
MFDEPAPAAPPSPAAPPADQQSRLGKFIQTYHTFLSTFVIGAAGLIATSIWQYKQSEIARRQAESEQQIAKTNAENQWRIERAEILSKNLQVLAQRGGNSADQRYGVLLSLTRGEILDPELAVSYALELGKDNPEYMKSVLSSTADKDYVQLTHAFTITCEERYGLARAIDLCKADEAGPRSNAIAQLVSDDAVAWAVSSAQAPGNGAGAGQHPLAVLADERNVQKEPVRLTWLYTPAVTQLYQHRQWAELRRFSSYSVGAHVVAALVVATARTGELAASTGENALGKMHEVERDWLREYVLGRTCDDDCRGRFADYLTTQLTEAAGDYDETLRKLLSRPAAESGQAIEKLHVRLMRCQVEGEDLTNLRDHVLVPALAEALAAPKPDTGVVDGLVDLLALVPDPADPAAIGVWGQALAHLAKQYPEKHKKGYLERRASADAERKNPPVALKKVTFCKVAESEPTGQEDE